jgi:hypothetical protein
MPPIKTISNHVIICALPSVIRPIMWDLLMSFVVSLFSKFSLLLMMLRTRSSVLWRSSFVMRTLWKRRDVRFNNENANIKKQLEQNENCIELLRSENNSLRDENATYKNDIKSCEDKVEDLEQYGRRTSLRFHNVLMTNDDLQSTDDLVLNIINNKLNLENKLTWNSSIGRLCFNRFFCFIVIWRSRNYLPF